MIVRADARRLPLADGTVDCVVTSVPYFHQRKYGAHEELEIGLEATVEAWLEVLVEVFREVRRALAPWGSVWLNCGDKRISKSGGRRGSSYVRRRGVAQARPVVDESAKVYDALGLPWRLAFALRADGWFLRQEVVWHKPNAQPETITGWQWERCRQKVGRAENPRAPRRFDTGPGDHRGITGAHPPATAVLWEDCSGCSRCEGNDGWVLREGAWRPTTVHETVFLLTQSPAYYADKVAGLEAVSGGAKPRGKKVNPKAQRAGVGVRANDDWTRSMTDRVDRRNGRSVWEISTRPSPRVGVDVDHFATFPEELPAKAIAIGTSERGHCVGCGRPWVRMVERRRELDGEAYHGSFGGGQRRHVGQGVGDWRFVSSLETRGWRPSCGCGVEGTRPALVLDPFGGSGTTAAAARALGRRAVSVDLSLPYCRLAKARLAAPSKPRRAAKPRRSLDPQLHLFQEDDAWT